MDLDAGLSSDDSLDPPARLFERLHQIAGYSWDETKRPIHTSYDNWHVFGTRFISPFSMPSSLPASYSHASVPSPGGRAVSSRASPAEPPIFSPATSEWSSDHNAGASPSPSRATFDFVNSPVVEEAVVARVSYHVLREERTFHVVTNIGSSADPRGEHIAKPIDHLRLNPFPTDRGPIIVAIYQFPGINHLPRYMDIGPAYYFANRKDDTWEAVIKTNFVPGPAISLDHFLDFAIGAAQCLELIHHNQNIVHGEIRGDAFHFNQDTGRTKLVAFGSGVRSFEHGLTSTGWSALSRELGAKNKLLYISPEQTGRMPAEPDSRTDIYSLGVLFWALLTQRPVYDGETPMDIVQGVLGRRIPNVSIVRIDVPDVIGRIIQKCTAKSIGDRYHSASGLRHDLVKVKECLASGDLAVLKEWQVASRDVSSFFLLPNTMIGRDAQRKELFRVIERVSRSHAMDQKGKANRFSDTSSFSNDFLDVVDGSSDGRASSADSVHCRSTSFTQTASSDPKFRNSFLPSTQSNDNLTVSADMSSVHSNGPPLRLPQRSWERHSSVSFDLRSPLDGSMTERDGSSRHAASVVAETATSLSRQLGSAKFRRRGHCEIIIVEGAAGVGKSCLIQSVMTEARRRGYCATAKFDKARKAAFGPLLHLLSSLFRQVWGERNTDTPFHQTLRQYVRPVWPTLHQLLGLPEFLFNSSDGAVALTRSPSNQQIGALSGKSTRPAELKQRGSSPASSASSNVGTAKCNLTGTTRSSASSSQEFLRAGTSTKSLRLMNTILDILRMFTSHKFICFCLDDLHFADAESLEMIAQIISARLHMVFIITYRQDGTARNKIQSILNPLEVERDAPKCSGPTVTKVQLGPLTEEEIIKYVALTLSRSEADVVPLALVLQAKTAGNPFYMREMLSACYRRKCIWYDYRGSRWAYDMNRVFEQFQGDRHYDILNTDFITNRLKELPPASRSILGWAALLGNAFSFSMICHLLSGEFNYIDDTCPGPLDKHIHASYSQQDAVAGLQVAIQACVIVQSETDDRFRFAHDRYIQASMDMKVCSAKKMHFVIAQTLHKYYSEDPDIRDSTASHICEAVDVIKARVRQRQPYRKLLYDCGRSATENGARSTAANYYSSAVSLLQSTPWSDDGDDASYEETIQLYLRAAECYLYMNQYSSASDILTTILDNAKSPFDKAPAWVLQSRIFAQSGNPIKALSSLKECLRAMNVQVREKPTYEQCDAEFEKLSTLIQGMSRSEVLNPPSTNDPATISIGVVLAEALSTSLWSDNLYIYHISQAMVNMHLTLGPFPQSGMGFLYLAMVAISRFGMIRFASDLGDYALELLDRFRDPYSMARSYILYAGLVGHIHYPLTLTVTQLEGSLEYSASSADRMSAILNFGVAAMIKFYASENCSDLEAFCEYCCEDVSNWNQDTQGGALLIAVRQLSRALQGKTDVSEALRVMSDEQHDAVAYKQWLEGHAVNAVNGERSLTFYESLELVPLYLYGHYDRALELGQRCMDRSKLMLSSRNTRLVMLFYGLALAGLMLRRQQDPRRPKEGDDIVKEQGRIEDTILKLQELRKDIQDWSDVSDINYFAWSTLLDAQISELGNDTGRALRQYEEALDHASEHNFIFEEALGNYLMAGIFIRKAARRSARSALRDAVGLYRQLGASGVAGRIEEEHSFLLRGPMKNPRTVDAAVQTDFTADHTSAHYDAIDGEMDQHTNSDILENTNRPNLSSIRGERIGVWRGAMQAEAETGIAGLPALDMIDLHAILQSSQIISSVLRVDELLKTMCDVILQTCGGSATQAAIIVQDEGESNWCVAASGDPERKAVAHIPGIPLTGTCIVAENVVLYSLRFREPVFVPDLVSDERFGNVNDQWLQKNQQSRSVISIPICHASNPLMGVLYLEGVQGAFTDRNVTVLQLLVSQIGISYSNALSMKATEKVSAENRSMVVLQKTALRKAIEAENKAKEAEKKAKQNLQLAEAAEAEAKRNVKVAEEATKAKSIFLANVSHELRTPLNGVIGNSELLRDSSLTTEQQEMAEAIRLSADLLLIVINDILDFSRMEADKMKLYITAFNPKELMPEVVRAASYRNQEKTKQGAVEITKQINLPPGLFVYGDPVRLHQVLGNLIGNSIKFTEKGTITVGARVESETGTTVTLTFWVEDTGIGIAPDQLANLFQPFSQADPSTARKYGGSGLGLSICKSLIELIMKGKICLESTQNAGTKVWFTVTFDKAKEKGLLGGISPATVPASSPGVDSTAPSPLSTSFPASASTLSLQTQQSQTRTEAQSMSLRLPSLQTVQTGAAPDGSAGNDVSNPYMDLSEIEHDQLRVCIAEDNPINRKIAIQYVQRLGYKTVDAYENGQMAVEALRQKAEEGKPYHVLLMDVQMPVLDGYEATKLLRKDPIKAVREVLVIAMTASAIQGDREKCLAAGMNDYLAKPVKSDVLRRKLDVYIGVQQPQDARETNGDESLSAPPASKPLENGSAATADVQPFLEQQQEQQEQEEQEEQQLESSATDTTPTKKLQKKLTKSRAPGDNAVVDRTKPGPSVLQKKNSLQRPDLCLKVVDSGSNANVNAKGGEDGSTAGDSGSNNNDASATAAQKTTGRQRSLSIASIISLRSKGTKGGEA